jgi:hypothetical protein
MTTGGWIIMLGSVGGVTIFLFWCVYRIIRCGRNANRVHGTLDIETPDLKDD